MDSLEKRLAHAVLRWFRAQSGPRHVQIAAEARLAALAKEILEL